MIFNFFFNIYSSLINFIIMINNESILIVNIYNGCENNEKQ